MSTLRPTPTIECIAALRDLGFEVERVIDRLVVLRRNDGRRVSIRRRSVLSADDLRVLMNVADVTYDAFAAALARRATPGAWLAGAESGIRERPEVLAELEDREQTRKV